MKRFFLLLMFIIFFVSCINKKEPMARNSCFSPNDIFFEYEEKYVKSIIINGTIYDTIPIKIFFDTGSPLNNDSVALSDSFKQMFENDIFLFKIKQKNYVAHPQYMNRDNNFLKSHGQNTIIVGWRFFEHKIIEISYQNKYIRELDNLEKLNEYICIPLEHDEFLEIQAKIFLQKSRIDEKVIIDTGFYGWIEMGYNKAEKYHVALSDSSIIGGKSINQSYNRWITEADSICIGSIGYTISNKFPMTFSEYKALYSRGGLLGNSFLENFDVVLDLIHYNLYLKPNKIFCL